MTKKKVVAIPEAGLCNRLRVIESAISLGKQIDLDVSIQWNSNGDMVAAYDELFERSPYFEIVHKPKYNMAKSSFYNHPVKKKLAFVLDKLMGIDLVFFENDVSKLIRHGMYAVAQNCSGKTTLFRTFHPFFAFHYNFSWVHPIKSIQEKINIVTSKFSPNMVGVHIRRTDNSMAIEHSPDILFENKMQEFLMKDPDTLFYLATDSLETQEMFINKFGREKVLFHDKKFGRDNVEATQDAVVDLFCLSSCQALLCSFFSSFSETAATMARLQPVILKK